MLVGFKAINSSLCFLSMSTSNGINGDDTLVDVDPAIHTLAIGVSRELNLVNPNDLLAKRLLDLAKQNDASLP